MTVSALKEVRMGFSIGTGYLAEFAVQWNSIELALVSFFDVDDPSYSSSEQ